MGKSNKYKGQGIAGNYHVRARLITIHNNYGDMPVINFDEEELFEVGNKFSSSPSGSCREVMTPENMVEEFVIRNPETGDFTGDVMTYSDFAMALHSLYFHIAEKRDNTLIEEEE